jgi:hypothetical protein
VDVDDKREEYELIKRTAIVKVKHGIIFYMTRGRSTSSSRELLMSR